MDKVVESSKKVDQKTVPGASNFHGQGPELRPPPYASWPPTPCCAECVGECCECGEPQGLLFTPGPGCFIFNILPLAPLRLEALQALALWIDYIRVMLPVVKIIFKTTTSSFTNIRNETLRKYEASKRISADLQRWRMVSTTWQSQCLSCAQKHWQPNTDAEPLLS